MQKSIVLLFRIIIIYLYFTYNCRYQYLLLIRTGLCYTALYTINNGRFFSSSSFFFLHHIIISYNHRSQQQQQQTTTHRIIITFINCSFDTPKPNVCTVGCVWNYCVKLLIIETKKLPGRPETYSTDYLINCCTFVWIEFDWVILQSIGCFFHQIWWGASWSQSLGWWTCLWLTCLQP